MMINIVTGRGFRGFGLQMNAPRVLYFSTSLAWFQAKSSCQLKHALSLWETIAVELARQLCIRGQEPFDSIRQEFLCGLSKDEENQFEALDRCLGQFDPDLLLGTIYEFVETYIKHCHLKEHDQP